MNKAFLTILLVNLLFLTSAAQAADTSTVIVKPKVNVQTSVRRAPVPTVTVQKTTSAPAVINLKPQVKPVASKNIVTTPIKLPQTTSVKSISSGHSAINSNVKVIQAVNKSSNLATVVTKPAVGNKVISVKPVQPLNKLDTSLTSVNYNVVKIIDGKVQDNFLNFISTLNKNGYKVEQINSDYGYIVFNARGNYRYVAVVTDAGNNKTAIKITNVDKSNDLLQNSFSNLF